MSNPIQQAIDGLEWIQLVFTDDTMAQERDPELWLPGLNEALSALQSLQGVELPDLPPPFMAQYGRVSSEVYAPWAEQMQAYARTAVAAAMARGEVARVKDDMHWQDVELLTSLVNSNRIAPSESSALFRLLEQATQPDVEDTGARCEPSDWVPPAGYDGDGSVEAMARRATQPEPCKSCNGEGGHEKALSSTNYTWVKCPDCEGTCKATQPTQAEAPNEREAFELDPLEKAIDAYVADYETSYDSGTYTPNDEERFRIKDAIMGLLADPEWDRLWGEHIAALATQQAGQGEAVYWQWRRKKDAWSTDKIFNTAVFATTSDSEVRALYTTPPAPQQPEALAPSESFVQNVPDHCDRIVWRGQYFHLPVGSPEALAQQDDAFEAAIRQTWQMIDPLRPPVAGSYFLGEHNGIAAALKTLRENYYRIRAARSSEGGQP